VPRLLRSRWRVFIEYNAHPHPVKFVHCRIAELLACPVCSAPLSFIGTIRDNRYVNGHFKCPSKHMFQVKEQIGLLKDARQSKKEFEWKIDVADEKKYLEIRREYDSYLKDDQRTATQKMIDKLVDLVARSSLQTDNIVLDIASGMGTFLIRLLDKISTYSTVMGTDVDERPLRGLLNRSLETGTYDKLTLIVTDAKHLCFKTASLSTVSSFFGFDNVPETLLALKECARILRPEGLTFFTSMWYREGSESMRLADQHNVSQIASEARLKNALAKSGLALNHVEQTYSGFWPHNPMDLLPVEGDEYTYVIVSAKKPRQ